MSSFNDGIEAALAALDERLTLIGGCGDGGCLVMPPKGMHTNGGCRCMWDKYKAQKTVHAYMAFVRSIRALAPAAPEPTEAEVERVALWLFEQHQRTQPYPITWDRAAEIGKERFRQQARAALAAMKGEG